MEWKVLFTCSSSRAEQRLLVIVCDRPSPGRIFWRHHDQEVLFELRAEFENSSFLLLLLLFSFLIYSPAEDTYYRAATTLVSLLLYPH
jgi:hypothetical protein